VKCKPCRKERGWFLYLHEAFWKADAGNFLERWRIGIGVLSKIPLSRGSTVKKAEAGSQEE
jgi:hypothetical protein